MLSTTIRFCTRRATRGLLALATSLIVAGCALATPAAPTTTTPTRTTDTFTGSFPYGGTATHQFKVNETGLVEVSINSMAPLSTMAVGLTVGTWNGTSCASGSIRNTDSRTGGVSLSGVTAAGDYCLTLFDSGNLPQTWTVTYSVQVTHP